MLSLPRQVDPKLRIFADPMLYEDDYMLRRAAPFVDIWSPTISGLTRRPWQRDLIHSFGDTVWSYDAHAGRRVHPYSCASSGTIGQVYPLWTLHF